ncbi:MAG: hypothetical protein PHR14_10025 [Oscillospiraceae bacterium]|nr:hypothetical protein [Oscillospiraceae bacterium]
MKQFFKSKKFLAILSGVVALALVITVVCVATSRKETVPTDTPDTSATESENDVIIDNPVSDTTNSAETTVSEISDDGNALKPDENTPDTEGSKNTGEKAQSNVTAAEEADPPADSKAEENTGGIQIGGIENNEEYSCGAADHHCKTAENHAYLLNLELEGCPYCGSHSCLSFYAVNEWGFPRCDPTKCPEYNSQKNPIEYCQTCGKKIGSGQNGTCTQYINACDCPFCGEHVESRTCHTCK